MRKVSRSKRGATRHRAGLYWALVLVGGLSAITLYFLYYYASVPLLLHPSSTVNMWTRTEEKQLQYSVAGEWQPLTIAGVVLEPLAPGGPEVTYYMYREWLSLIQSMNSNTITVQDIMSPDFYRAFYDHNTQGSDKLLLLQGITLKDETYAAMVNAFAGDTSKLLIKRAYSTIDIIHGAAKRGPTPYIWDVSDWTLGYIVGADWDPDLVLYTNDACANLAGYKGKYISTWPTASAFDTILAMVGDRIFAYETGKYGQQRLLGFANWARTDPLFHDSSWSVGLNENLSHVNMELITVHPTVQSGVFMAYHVEPSYPHFLSFDPKYANHVDEEGTINPYRGYLQALNEYHRFPIVVTSFGVPTSRGVSSIDEQRGFNQGGLTEQEQGIALQILFRDIVQSGTAGGCIHSWTDTWGAVAWSNANNSAEFYGLVAYEPGEQQPASHVDGALSEWSEINKVVQGEGLSLQIMFDEKYLYLCATVPNFQPGKGTIYIPLDITPNSGAQVDTTNGLVNDRGVDFVIVIDGPANSKVLVQEYYNSLYALYPKEMERPNIYTSPPSPSSGKFELVRQMVRLSMADDNHGRREPYLKDIGLLRHGNSNPSTVDYDSLADFHYASNGVEIRLPWGMLNFSDPSAMTIHDDYYKNYGIKPLSIDSIYAGLIYKDQQTTINLPSGEFALEGWGDSPTWHTRLKRSYEYVKEAFSTVNP